MKLKVGVYRVVGGRVGGYGGGGGVVVVKYYRELGIVGRVKGDGLVEE